MLRHLFARHNRSFFGQWWWTVDRWLLMGLCLLMGIGTLLCFAGTPFIAKKLGHSSFYLVEKQLLLVVPTFCLMIGVSMMPLALLKRLALIVFCVGFLLLAVTPFYGMEIKGARRWISLGGFSIQPSEFVKPTFVLVSAWILSGIPLSQGLLQEVTSRPKTFSFGVYLLVILFLVLEPDFGMSFVVTLVWVAQIFLAGLSLFWVVGIALCGFVGLGAGYLFFPHVTSRIDRFLDPEAGDRYQINRSLEAFTSGGFFGQGPGEGVVKKHLPDAHSDFIFAVAGEEFGLFFCLLIVLIYGFIFFRSVGRAYKQNDFFLLLGISGLTLQFTFQAIINMASSLHIIPTKGMTLPFLSYGGSSLLAVGVSMGALLNLTRKRRFEEGC